MKTAGYSHNCCLFTSFHASHQPASVRSATIYIIVFVSCLISPCPGPERQNAAGMNECYCCSVAKLCLILRDTMDRSIPGSSVFHYPRVCSNSCPLSRWCYLSISSSVTLFSFCLQSFSASGCFAKNQLFTSGGQSTGVSISAWVLPMNIQGWVVWSPCYPRDSQESSLAPKFERIISSALSFLYGPTLTSVHDY